MLYTFLQQAPAETTTFMIAGYSVIFGIILLYIISIFVRRRNLKRDLDTLNEMESQDK